MTTNGHTEIVKVSLKAKAGSDVTDCINDAIAFCATYEMDCTLSHNGEEIEVSINKLRDELYKNWSKKMGHK